MCVITLSDLIPDLLASPIEKRSVFQARRHSEVVMPPVSSLRSATALLLHEEEEISEDGYEAPLFTVGANPQRLPLRGFITPIASTDEDEDPLYDEVAPSHPGKGRCDSVKRWSLPPSSCLGQHLLDPSTAWQVGQNNIKNALA